MPDLAFLNGEILSIGNAYTPIEDRGYQFGDAVYEFIESFDEHIFRLDAHLNRLKLSLEALDFPKISTQTLKQDITALFKQSGYKRAGLYLQVSRGVEPRDHSYSNSTPPVVSMTIKTLEGLDPSINEKGIKIRTCVDYRWGMCHIKTVQLLPAALEQHRAKKMGLSDTVFISKKGIVREGTCTNLFIVKEDILFTHPLDNHILPGITRDTIINRICKSLNITVKEQYFNIDQFYSAKEAFLCSTVLKIQPIIEADGKTIGNRLPGPITRQIQAEYDRQVYHR
jgi:D-alanine transaminase